MEVKFKRQTHKVKLRTTIPYRLLEYANPHARMEQVLKTLQRTLYASGSVSGVACICESTLMSVGTGGGTSGGNVACGAGIEPFGAMEIGAA